MTLADMFADPNAERRARCAETAREWIAREPLILDTETTGLSSDDEIVSVAVIDCQGRTLLYAVVRPTIPIPEAASKIHGLTDAVVERVPNACEIMHHLWTLLSGRLVAAYNANYDHGRLARTAGALHVDCWPPAAEWVDIMGLYAEYHGESGKYSGYKWQSLENACRQMEIEAKGAHNALSDCRLTLKVLRRMAE